MKETVEPLIDYYRPKGVTRLGFKKVSLGSVPPKVVGIRTLDTNESCAILDLEVREPLLLYNVTMSTFSYCVTSVSALMLQQL